MDEIAVAFILSDLVKDFLDVWGEAICVESEVKQYV